MSIIIGKPLSNLNTSQNKSEIFLRAAGDYFHTASQLAASGDLNAAAILILKALDQERRANGLGFQVLKLIKTS